MKRRGIIIAAALAFGFSFLTTSHASAEVKEMEGGGRIEGTWISEQQEGPGRIYYADGRRFEGFWVHGLLEGSAIVFEQDGRRGIFTYYNDKANGPGLVIDKDGNAESMFHEDHKIVDNRTLTRWDSSDGVTYFLNARTDLNDGKAIALYPDESVYIGEFHNGKKDGWGTLYSKDGGWYTGEWENDVKNGVGYYIFQEKEDVLCWQGIWENGQLEGGHVQHSENGGILVAVHENGKAEGPGVYINPDGIANLYEYKDGAISNSNPDIYTAQNGDRFIGGTDGNNGYGLRLRENGDVYIGNFKNGKKDGEGFYYWAKTGEIFEGTTKADDILDGARIFPYGSYFRGAYWEGEGGHCKSGVSRSFREHYVGTYDVNGKYETGTLRTFHIDGSCTTVQYKDGEKTN